MYIKDTQVQFYTFFEVCTFYMKISRTSYIHRTAIICVAYLTYDICIFSLVIQGLRALNRYNGLSGDTRQQCARTSLTD